MVPTIAPVSQPVMYNQMGVYLQISQEDMMEIVGRYFESYLTHKLDKIKGMRFDKLKQAILCDGGDDLKTMHSVNGNRD